MNKKHRVYISIYFQDCMECTHRKKRDLTIAFNANDKLYKICKNLGSSKIKKIIGIETYNELLEKAKKEDRSLNNYIKHKLRVFYENRQ